MVNMQIRFPWFIPCVSLKLFPSLSPLHLPSRSTHNSHYSLCCFVLLPAFSCFLCHPLWFQCRYWKHFFVLFSISYVVCVHLSSASMLSSLYPSTLPSELHSACQLPSYQQCKSSTGDTALPVVSRLNDIFGLALSDSSRQETKTNLSPTLTPHLLLLFVFYNTNMLSAVIANITKLEYIDCGRQYKINTTRWSLAVNRTSVWRKEKKRKKSSSGGKIHIGLMHKWKIKTSGVEILRISPWYLSVLMNMINAKLLEYLWI